MWLTGADAATHKKKVRCDAAVSYTLMSAVGGAIKYHYYRDICFAILRTDISIINRSTPYDGYLIIRSKYIPWQSSRSPRSDLVLLHKSEVIYQSLDPCS